MTPRAATVGYLPPALQLLLSRLSMVRGSSTGWSARCPGHDDSTPSLRVGLGRDGKVLVFCHAGCPTESVLAAIGLRFADLSGNPPPMSGHRRGSSHSFASPPAGPPNSTSDGHDVEEVWNETWDYLLTPEPDPGLDAATIAYLESRGLREALDLKLCRALRADDANLPACIRWWPARGYTVVAPLFDRDGRIANLQTRSIIAGRKPKTLNPAGSIVAGCSFANFAGVALLSGESRARTVILGEGMTDSLALGLAAVEVPVLAAPGVGAAEAALGTWVHDRTLVIALDNDERGEINVEGVAEHAFRLGATAVRRVRWPSRCKDACDVVERVGIAGLRKFLIEKGVIA